MMKQWRHSVCLLLALGLCLALCACGGSSSLTGGTWTPVEDEPFQLEDYMFEDPDPIDTVEDLPPELASADLNVMQILGNMQVNGVQKGQVLEQVTVSRIESNGKMTQVYAFQDGVTVTWHEFFCPDTTKVMFPWRTDPESIDWKLRIVDLTTGEEADIPLPEWDGTTELLLARWLDNTTLQVAQTALSFSDSVNPPGIWTYTLPN